MRYIYYTKNIQVFSLDIKCQLENFKYFSTKSKNKKTVNKFATEAKRKREHY